MAEARGEKSQRSESEIAKWYRGKAIFITGSTGFMGKVLLEKLLRSCPDVGPIYVLVREKKEILSQNRVEDMLTSCLFERLRSEKIPVDDRLVAIPGDVGLPELGISAEDRRLLQDTVSVVFHVAASVRFDEPLRVAVAMNLNGTKAILKLCQGMTNLTALVHVSTAYTNCTTHMIQERVYPPPADPDKVIKYVEGLDENSLDFVTSRVITDHPNTYTFTKALAEDVVSKYSMELPIVIVRPSIVSPSWKEPIPGWVDNFNGPTAIIIGSGKGLLRTIYGQKHVTVDLTPVDVCINLFIAAAWEIGSRESAKLVPDVLVYNCVSGPFNPITWDKFMSYSVPCVAKYPMSDAFMAPDISMTAIRIKHVVKSFIYQYIPAIVGDFFIWTSGGKPKFRRYLSKLNHMVAILEFFTTHEWEFDGDNVRRLKERLNPTDRRIFDFDMTKVNWKEYSDSYILGIRRYVLKENDDTILAAQERIKKLKNISTVFKACLTLAVVIYFFRHYNISFMKIIQRIYLHIH